MGDFQASREAGSLVEVLPAAEIIAVKLRLQGSEVELKLGNFLVFFVHSFILLNLEGQKRVLDNLLFQLLQCFPI